MLHTNDMDQTQRILDAAQRIRVWAENLPANRRRRDQRSLDGFCAIASARLWLELRKQGITAELRVHTDSTGASHVFLAVDDHVLDITATQFGLKPVVYMHEREAARYRFYDVWHVFSNPRDLQDHQRAEGWPADQTVKV